MIISLVRQAATFGLDPAAGWDRTIEELCEFIDASTRRMEMASMWGYNLAQGIAAMCFAKDKPKPYQIFPGWIPMPEQSEDEMLQACLAWCR